MSERRSTSKWRRLSIRSLIVVFACLAVVVTFTGAYALAAPGGGGPGSSQGGGPGGGGPGGGGPGGGGPGGGDHGGGGPGGGGPGGGGPGGGDHGGGGPGGGGPGGGGPGGGGEQGGGGHGGGGQGGGHGGGGEQGGGHGGPGGGGDHGGGGGDHGGGGHGGSGGGDHGGSSGGHGGSGGGHGGSGGGDHGGSSGGSTSGGSTSGGSTSGGSTSGGAPATTTTTVGGPVDSGTNVETTGAPATGTLGARFTPTPLDWASVGWPEDKPLTGTLAARTIVLNPVYFDFDEDVLCAEQAAEVDKAIAVYRENPGTTFVLVGHTDSYGSDAYNMDLAWSRVNAVRDYLVAHGVPTSAIMVDAKGENAPAATNDTSEGRALNRRVTIAKN